MGRIPHPTLNPKAPEEIAEHLLRVHREVDGKIEFGSPQDPTNPTSTTRANGVAHNGLLQNIDGAFFEAVLTATGRSAVTAIHNLNVGTQNPAGTPNVRWLVFGVMHDGTAADATTTYTLNAWYQGGAITADQLAMAMNLVIGGTAPTINGTHPVVVTLFFTKAVR